MKNEIIFFNSEAVVDFLLKFGKGMQTKDYEFMAAILFKNFCEKQWERRCEIGFKFKLEYRRHLKAIELHDLSQIAALFRKGIEENNSTDFVVATEGLTLGDKRKGLEVQVKRFGIGRSKKDTPELIKYIHSLSKSYGKSNECLLISLDMEVEVDFAKVKEALNADTFPFGRLMFTWMDKEKVCIAEIFPQYGMEEYNLADMIG